MVNNRLSPRPALGGYELTHAGIQVKERVDTEVFSLACRESEKASVNDGLQSSLGVVWPEVGSCSVSTDSSVRVLGLQRDQVFVVLNSSQVTDGLLNALTNVAWCTQQSDSWATLEISGPNQYQVLECTCPIDLSPSVFTEHHVARTSMEHLSSIIYRNNDSFVLMTPTSSARGFLHMIEESIQFVD